MEAVMIVRYIALFERLGLSNPDTLAFYGIFVPAWFM
jgi:hypothetical protein